MLVTLAFRALELRSFPVLLMVFKAALAMLTFFLAGGLRGRVWIAVTLSVTAQCILGAVPLGPGYCSMLLFAVELLLLERSRSAGSVQSLFWLPPLFLVWANLDLQFVYGVGALALFLAASFFRKIELRSVAGTPRKKTSSKKVQAISPASAGIVAVLCVIATILTPYSYHLYGTFFTSVSSAANVYFADSLAMTFHSLRDLLLLMLTMCAFLALGRRRSRDAFQIGLITGCALLSFHAQRDGWLLVLAALAMIPQGGYGRFPTT